MIYLYQRIIRHWRLLLISLLLFVLMLWWDVLKVNIKFDLRFSEDENHQEV